MTTTTLITIPIVLIMPLFLLKTQTLRHDKHTYLFLNFPLDYSSQFFYTKNVLLQAHNLLHMKISYSQNFCYTMEKVNMLKWSLVSSF